MDKQITTTPRGDAGDAGDVELQASYLMFRQHFTLYSDPNLLSVMDTLGKEVQYNAIYCSNFLSVILTKEKSYHCIVPNRLYLGMQPNVINEHPIHKGTSDDEQIKGLNVAVVENHELTGSIIGSSKVLQCFLPKHLEDAGVTHHWLCMPDFTAEAHNELIIDTIYRMQEFYQKQLPIFVHCKSGKGRSALIVNIFLAYLFFILDPTVYCMLRNYRSSFLQIFQAMKSDDQQVRYAALMKFVESLEALMKTKRSIVKLHDDKKEKAVVILDLLIQRHLANRPWCDQRSNNHWFVDGLAQSRAFKRLSMYLSGVKTRHSNRAKIVEQFLYRVINNVPGWYEELAEAADGRDDLDGVLLGHFSHCSPVDEIDAQKCNQKRLEYVQHLKFTIDYLLRQHPESTYASTNLDNIRAPNADLLPRFKL